MKRKFKSVGRYTTEKEISKESINPPVKRGAKRPISIDVSLSDELHGSMRKIQAIGNPFQSVCIK